MYRMVSRVAQRRMEDNMSDYFGHYENFEAVSKKEAAQLLGADNLVGDIYEIENEIIDKEHRAWLISRFGKRVGYFKPKVSRELGVKAAQGMTCRAILCFVAFTDHPDDGHYWGEVALICFNPAYAAAFEKFIANISKRIGDGVRPAIDLDGKSIQQIIDSNGEWAPTQNLPLRKNDKGTAIIKSRRSISDKLIEQGRAGNKGCYIVSWIFLLVLVAFLLFGLYSCFS